jgi:hypothetical protein
MARICIIRFSFEKFDRRSISRFFCCIFYIFLQFVIHNGNTTSDYLGRIGRLFPNC